MENKVYFIGIGPGDFELLTLKAWKVIKNSDVIIYPGSLANPEMIKLFKNEVPHAEFHDSASYKLEDIIEIIEKAISQGKKVARLVSGDPAFYSAIQEQIEILRDKNISYEIISGISSAVAGASKLGIELTYLDLCHTVIFTRFAGKTGGATQEEIKKLAIKRALLIFFLSATYAKKLEDTLLEVLPENTPIAILYRICQKGEKIIFGTLKELNSLVQKENIKKTALIYVGEILNAVFRNFGKRSKLYGG
ncbi:MAG: cobalt-precorrin-4 C(11)-methyltransferase [Thermodesulfobacteriota bacterium]|nr:MAG: cobalt-precorrin-4 C(11)-methyltransferase [Thermodesulfobacteriota bacterium]